MSMSFRYAMCVLICGAAATAQPLAAAEPLTLENVVAPAKNSADEPFAEKFSPESAKHFLDAASLDWLKTRKCFTCHTNYSYLLARPAFQRDEQPQQLIRGALEELVEQRWPESGPRWDAEVVMAAAALAHHDASTTGQLHPTTRAALDRMWTVQRDDGGFNWLKCNWPPMESDDHYGATMAAIGVGVAPSQYSQTPAAAEGLGRLRTYLKNNPPPTLHHKAMLVWAASYLDGTMSDRERETAVGELLALQRPDGGWALASLGDWKRGDDKQQDRQTSDGYGTGFVIYVLRRGGVPAEHPQMQKGVAWLKTHQRASGRWFTRSLNKDNHHFISHAGTAMAVLALDACGQLAAPQGNGK